jgi:hypothetical protein
LTSRWLRSKRARPMLRLEELGSMKLGQIRAQLKKLEMYLVLKRN